MLLQHTDN